MEETISTTVETPEVQTTPEVTETSRSANAPASATQPEEVQTTEEVTTEPDKTEETTTENVETGNAEVKEAPKDWERIAKDNQASFTRVSQELAELKKQIEAQKPKIVENGKINPKFEQQYRFQIDDSEFRTYENLSYQLDPEAKEDVSKLLREAQRLYNPDNLKPYETKMSQVKDFFRSDIVEAIANKKQTAMGKIQEEFNRKLFEDRQERAALAAQKIQSIPEIFELVDEEGENFAPEVLGIVQAMFNYSGDVDIEATKGAIEKIEALGVKKYLAHQKAEQEKAKAIVPVGSNVVQNNGNSIPTREELLNPETYRKAVKKFGMDKVDAVIMKG